MRIRLRRVRGYSLGHTVELPVAQLSRLDCLDPLFGSVKGVTTWHVRECKGHFREDPASLFTLQPRRFGSDTGGFVS